MQLLLNIRSNSFSEDLYNGQIMFYLLQYQTWFNAKSARISDPVRQLPEFYNAYFTCIHNFARTLLKQVNPDTPEGLLCLFFSGDFNSFYTNLNSPQYEKTRLKYYHSREIRSVLNNRHYFHVSLDTDFWVPSGHAEKLGNHPAVGLSVGDQRNRVHFSVHYLFRFLRTANSLDKFSGNIVGAYIGYDILRLSGKDLYCFAGGQYGLYDISTDHSGYDVKSFSLDVGAGLRHCFGSLRQYSLSPRLIFHITDFEDSMDSNLNGNAVSLNISFGASFDTSSDRKKLYQLGYFKKS